MNVQVLRETKLEENVFKRTLQITNANAGTPSQVDKKKLTLLSYYTNICAIYIQ